MREGVLSFKLKDKVLGSDVSLDNLSLPLLAEYTEDVAQFLKGHERRLDLTSIKTSVKSGSLVLAVENEAGVLDDALDDYKHIAEGDLSAVDEARASIIEKWQQEVYRYPDRLYELIQDVVEDNKPSSSVITISKDTDYKKPQDVWVTVEKYVYGRIFDLGGKNVANVHLDLDTGTTIKVGAETKLLVEDKTNRLYRNQLVRISAEQNIRTKKLRNEKLISFENYSPHFDEDEFASFTEKGTVAWKSVSDPSQWIEELRGNA